jgi:hypothetical protein
MADQTQQAFNFEDTAPPADENQSIFGYTAEGLQQEADKYAAEFTEDDASSLETAASYLVPYYDSGVNIANVVEEYLKPEEERDYDYIKSQFKEAGQSAALETGLLLMGGVATKYGAKGIKALANKARQYELDPNSMSAFGVGALRKKDTFEEIMTPVKVTKKGTKKTGETILRPSADLASDLDPRLGRAMAAETAGSIMPGPGKFFDPSKKGYKGDRFTGMLKDADIDLDLEFGNYIMMGKGAPKDVSNETFENLFVSARPSQKKTTFGQNNKSVARANLYDGPSLTIADMKSNYLRNTNKPGKEVRTNLLQPERFSMVTDEGKRSLDHPIVAVQSMSGKKDHFYTLDTQFVGPVRMDRLTKKVNRKNKDTGKVTEEVPQPNLRPATVGDINLGEQIGTIKVGKKEHPLYDYIEVDATAAAPEGMGSISKFKKGGMAMDDQMKLTFKSRRTGYALGGEVEAIDPVSGNEVPPGSTPEEVRDDIPAMLSEGEYVVPADVTRYYGVKFFEDLRQQAKVDLEGMAANGRIGGEPMPEGEDDLTEDEMALLQEVMAQGEPVAMNQGGAVSQQVPYLSPQQPMNNPQLGLDPSQPTSYTKPLGMAAGGSVAKDPFGNPIQPVTQSPNQPAYSVLPLNPTNPQGIYGVSTAAGTPYTAATPPTTRAVVDTPSTPTTGTSTPTTDTSTSTGGMATKFYINKDCVRISVLTLNGKPISSVPANFNEYLEDTPENSASLGCTVTDIEDTTDTTDTDTDTVTAGTSVDVGDDNAIENYNVNVKTTVDPDTPEGASVMFEDSGVSLKDPLTAAKTALNEAFKVSKGAGSFLTAINPFLGVAGAGINAVSQLSALSKANANLKMADFLGMTEASEAIQKEIDSFLEKAPGIVSALDSVFAKGDERFNNAIEAATSVNAPDDAVIYTDSLTDVGKKNVNNYLIENSPSLAGATVDDSGSIVMGPAAVTTSIRPMERTTTAMTASEFNAGGGGTTSTPSSVAAAESASTAATKDWANATQVVNSLGSDADPADWYAATQAQAAASVAATKAAKAATEARNNDDDPSNDGNSGGCFLTTAVVGIRGEADNGLTLTKLRNFRDTYMAAIPADVEEYYRVAPQIVASIPADHKDWHWIGTQIDKSVEFIDNKLLDDAYKTYKAMVKKLERDWL